MWKWKISWSICISDWCLGSYSSYYVLQCCWNGWKLSFYFQYSFGWSYLLELQQLYLSVITYVQMWRTTKFCFSFPCSHPQNKRKQNDESWILDKTTGSGISATALSPNNLRVRDALDDLSLLLLHRNESVHIADNSVYVGRLMCICICVNPKWAASSHFLLFSSSLVSMY